VVRILIDHGINASRLKAIGYGESRPVADNNTEEGRQRNRRVVAVITTVVSK
jgi:outer membrane protein OmpA-like peptidoglycan-associated protein